VTVVSEEQATCTGLVEKGTQSKEWSNRGRWAVAWSPRRGVFSFKHSAGANMEEAKTKHVPAELEENPIEYF
jgi:hypothetical protein